MSNFNPYQEWLGFSGRGKPTYYQLLGLQLLESDPEKIRRGARIQARKLQRLDVGHREAARDQILERIERAVVCLTDAEKKANYDRQIRERIELHRKRVGQTAKTNRQAATQSSMPLSPPGNADCVSDDDLDEFDLFADQKIAETEAADIVDKNLPVAVPLATTTEAPRKNQPAGGGRTTIRAEGPSMTACPLPVLDEQLAVRAINRKREISRYLRPRRPHRLLLPLTVVCIAALIFGSSLMVPSLTATWFGADTDTTSRTPPAPNSPTQVGVHSSAQQEVEPVTELTSPGPPVDPKSTISADDDSSMPAGARAAAALVPARESAMPGPRNETTSTPSAESLARLGQLLTEARQLLAERNVSSARDRLRQAEPLLQRSNDRAMFDRLALLTDYVEEYWKASRDGLQQLNGGDEFKFKGTRVFVVERTNDTIVLRVRGRNFEYHVDNLPIGLATAMANRWLDPASPSTKVFQGAMMAVDPNYDVEDARKVWREAAATGQFDLDDLLQVLDDQYDLRSE